MPHHVRTLLALTALAAPLAAQGPSEEAYAYFEKNCVSCHTIGGGRLAGPDLRDVTERQTREWLERFIADPPGVIASGDPYAAKILSEARGVPMPKLPGMTRELAGKLLDVIEAESALEESRFAGVRIDDRPLTEADIERGRELFLGTRPFASGAPACIGCHSMEGVGGLGGGQLGPDLTTAYARLEGRKAIGAWLSSPPSTVMAPVYHETPLEGEEILALIAWLEESARTGESEAEPAQLEFLFAGFGSAAALLVLLDFIWRSRYRDTRRSLLERSRR